MDFSKVSREEIIAALGNEDEDDLIVAEVSRLVEVYTDLVAQKEPLTASNEVEVAALEIVIDLFRKAGVDLLPEESE
jgi:hypothetical protein